jgi:hypothetical protein
MDVGIGELEATLNLSPANYDMNTRDATRDARLRRKYASIHANASECYLSAYTTKVSVTVGAGFGMISASLPLVVMTIGHSIRPCNIIQ